MPKARLADHVHSPSLRKSHEERNKSVNVYSSAELIEDVTPLHIGKTDRADCSEAFLSQPLMSGFITANRRRSVRVIEDRRF